MPLGPWFRKLCGCCNHTEVSQIFFNFEVSTAKPVTHYINYYYNATIKFGSKYLIEPLDFFFFFFLVLGFTIKKIANGKNAMNQST